MTRDKAIVRIKRALRRRSGRVWSVRGGTNIFYGKITITTLSRDRDERGKMQYADRKTLRELLGLSELPHEDGIRIGTLEDYQEYVDRAEGWFPRVIAD